MLRVASVVGPVQRDHTGLHETGQVVDVAAGFVVDDALAEPDHVAHAEVGPAGVRSICGRSEIGIAIGVEQALFGDQRRTLAIDVDRARLR